MHLLSILTPLAHSVVAEQSKRFFKTGPGEYGEGDQFLGIRVPELRKVAKKHMHISDNAIIEALHSPYHEVRLTGLFIWVYQFQKAKPQRQKEIYHLYLAHIKHVNNWDLVDTTAPLIIGAYLSEHPDVNRSFLYEFVQSEHVWIRRIAILSTFTFIKNGDFTDVIKLSELLLHDKHDLIHKAVGWMLRETGKQNKAALIAFLNEHARSMPRTMLRYSIERLDSKQRQYYMDI